MRVSAYKRLIDQANKLPLEIGDTNLNAFRYQPREEAIYCIINNARYDDRIVHFEFVEIYNYANERKDSKGRLELNREKRKG